MPAIGARLLSDSNIFKLDFGISNRFLGAGKHHKPGNYFKHRQVHQGEQISAQCWVRILGTGFKLLAIWA
jgi:hypothetical protein